MTRHSERGIALIATLLIMMLVSALLVGFTAAIVADQRFRGVDRDRQQAFYASHAGLEKLTADLGNYFQTNYAPTSTQVAALTVTPPSITGISFTAANAPSVTGLTTVGLNGYAVSFQPDGNGNPAATSAPVSSGPYQGLMAEKTPYTIDVTARTIAGSEVHLTKTLETVAIPLFQFGMFSNTDLSFFPGSNFNFGGRVQTNGNLFLASNAVLTLSDKVTAVGQVIRQNLSNGASIALGPNVHTGTVSLIQAPGAFRNLQPTEGSLTGFLGSAANPNWTTISLSTYNSYIRNALTGAVTLNLPVITAGGATTDIVRRPASATENVTNAPLFNERYFGKASLRILLSDTAADITSLPTVAATAPILLDGNWTAAPPAGYGTGGDGVDATHPPIATSYGSLSVNTSANTASGAATITVTSTVGFPASGTLLVNGTTEVTYTSKTATQFKGCVGTPATTKPVPVATGYLTPAGTGVVGGYLKVEMQDNNNNWTDVTTQMINYGIASPNQNTALACGGLGSANDPTPNAIVRLQRVADMPSTAAAAQGSCGAVAGNASSTAADYWPLALFDAREGLQRDNAPGNNEPVLGGVMYYVMLDVKNLSSWFKGTGAYAGGTGTNALNNNGTGYVVYFSDRRNNENAASAETGEFGFEDVINPADPNGVPNGVLDSGEDVNGNGVLDTYGQFPSYGGVPNSVAPGSLAPLTVAASPTTSLPALQAQVNRPVLFRRALKLVNGTLGNIVSPGLAIYTENPVYLQGDWNASVAAGWGNPHVATSIAGDALTLLGNEWNDDNSFANPYNPANRARATSPYYRVAIVAGKNASFPIPAWEAATSDFGTDGGTHNFLRYLESGGTVNYMGSLTSFYYSRQAVGVYKCCNTVYSAPTRAYQFDTDFLTPTLLPPLTPVFRDLDTLGFSQELRPGK